MSITRSGLPFSVKLEFIQAYHYTIHLKIAVLLREMDFSWTEKELSCRELLKSHVDFQTKGTQTPTIIIFHIIHNYVKCIGF